jgi:hypothetical protein
MKSVAKYHGSFTDRLHKPFGLDAETAPALWIILGGALAALAIIMLTHGNVIAAFAVLITIGLVALTFYRIDYSLFALLGCVMLFDQYHIPGFEPYTFRVDYFRNLKEMRFLPSFEAGVVNPIEIHILLILFVWFLVLAIKKKFTFRRVPVWGAFCLFFGWFAFAFAYGMQGGGDFLIALWELRALFYLSIMYVVIPQVIRDKKHLKIVMWIIIFAIFFKALQGLARYASLGFSMGGLPTLTNHEDPVFMVTLFILLLGFWLFNVKDNQKTVLLLMLLPMIAAFLIANRRAAMAALIVSLFVFFILLPGRQQWKFFKWAFPVLVIIVLYGAALWNVDNRFSQPVQMVKSGIERPDREENPRDYYSNLYREYENYNLAYTTRQNPLFGTGFGRAFELPLSLAEIDYPLRDYIPHNQIFWVIVKSGSVGFFLFWFFFNSFAFQATWIRSRLNDPYLKSICTVVVVAIIAQMVVSYYDLQLTYYRNMIYLGTLMGLVPVLEDLDAEEPEVIVEYSNEELPGRSDE